MSGSGTEALFDTGRYCLHDRMSTAYRDLVAHAREELRDDNCVVLPDFVRTSVLQAMQAESAAKSDTATYTEKWLNPYFSEPPDDVPENHPLKRMALRCHGMVRADRFAHDGTIRALFNNADLCRFVADCLDHETLHAYRDPYGCVNINVQKPGREFSWHFDHNEFTVSMLLREPEGGGIFEYVPDIRTREDENFEAVRAVLDGERESVRTLALKPGDLQLFRGGYTLHRVTAPTGNRDRHSLLLSYVTDPDHIATPEYAERLWGEVHPLHQQTS